VIKIDQNTKGVVMFDRAQWFLAGMSIALSVQLSQPVAAAVSVSKVVQTAQTNSNDAAKKVFEEAQKLNQQGTADSKRRAIVKFEQALKLYREARDRRREALTLNNIGLVYSQLGEKQKALEYYSQSLSLSRATGHRFGEAVTLNNIGSVYSALYEKQKALEYYSQSLSLRRAVGDRRGEAVTLNNIGGVYSELGEKQKALEYYSQSLRLRRAVGDRSGEALTLYNMAYAKREQNNLTEALNDIESSLKIIENLRTNITSPELRSSYFATMQEYYEFYIDLLMQLHKTNPNSGYDIKASEASERARTR
jgi:tetratricopeptide (TPR) repeat protein